MSMRLGTVYASIGSFSSLLQSVCHMCSRKSSLNFIWIEDEANEDGNNGAGMASAV